ncbi:MAG: ribonuclease D [Pseudomonadota bacterium]|nr:ribonuclease D [Pseudomonadota bacterium]
MIKNHIQLNNYLKIIKDANILGIDTEFRRVDSYFPELCLIQIATEDQIECIDVLSILNLEPLFTKLYDAQTKWIVHSARQDIEALYFLSKRIPKTIFDTQIAASFLNFPLQISYQSLTEKLENVVLEKKHTRFDWKMRPLPSDVLQYAIDDVKYLIPIYKKLSKELIKHKKIEWAMEEFEFLLKIDTYEPNIRQIIKKTKGISKISSQNKGNAIKLVFWREFIAQKKNKPRKWIMSDEKLISYANGNNKLPSRSLNEFKNFLKTNNKEFKLENLIKVQKPLSDKELLIKNKLKEQINALSLEYNIPSELICTSKSLTNFIRGEDLVSINKGWRSKIFKL